ncbi:MAG: hypothetical protein K8S14_09060 [Actinomycetia bacterium]|nr:hypothetical protein [Actinomycetes bacterium]
MSKIILFGNGLGSIECVKILQKDASIDKLLVVTHSKGKAHYWHESLWEYCINQNIPVIKPTHVTDLYDKFKSFGPNIIFSAYYDQILSSQILCLAKHAINFHPSLLPKYKGTAPLIWAIVKGEIETGITAHEMVSKVDSGKICGVLKIKIANDDTGFDLYKKAVKATGIIFQNTYKKIQSNALVYHQQTGKSSYFSNSTPRVNKLDPLNQTSKEIYNIVRALSSPLPMAYIIYKGEKVFIDKVACVDNIDINMFTDKILIEYKNNYYIKTKDGVLNILKMG